MADLCRFALRYEADAGQGFIEFATRKLLVPSNLKRMRKAFPDASWTFVCFSVRFFLEFNLAD